MVETKTMIYREEGFKAEVELLANELEGAGYKKTLKVIKILQEDTSFKKNIFPKEGAIFSVWAAEGFQHYAGWTLNYW